MIRSAVRSFPTLLRVGFADALAYRAEFLVWLLATNMPLVMLALWSAVAREEPIGGWGQEQFAAYFLAALFVRLVTGSWVVWELNYELRQGMLAFRLLRPIHPLVHYAAENLAALPLRGLFALPIAAVSLWAVGGEHLTRDAVNLAVFPFAVFGAWLLNFLTMAVIGALGFWVESSLSLFQVWFGFYMLLSGYLVPLDLLPAWLSGAAQALPFRYLLGLPVEVLLGSLDARGALLHLGVQWAYVAATLGLLALLWRAGMRRFNAYGG